MTHSCYIPPMVSFLCSQATTDAELEVSSSPLSPIVFLNLKKSKGSQEEDLQVYDKIVSRALINKDEKILISLVLPREPIDIFPQAPSYSLFKFSNEFSSDSNNRGEEELGNPLEKVMFLSLSLTGNSCFQNRGRRRREEEEGLRCPAQKRGRNRGGVRSWAATIPL
ncbi:hypothetical protein KSP40_PGU012274 [Platanthera guangdongensis]|uniref:Uncharacterized protein n=1 Tax=Platanthera guangdongensis TaxID=2320717 RepID=A0ABR2M7E5_9ASPA